MSSQAPLPLSPRVSELRHFQPSLALASTSQPFSCTRLPLRAASYSFYVREHGKSRGRECEPHPAGPQTP